MKRLEKLDRSLEKESIGLQEVRDRLLRLREAAAAQKTVSHVVVPSVTPEVAHLRDMVSQLQAQLAKSEVGLRGQAMDEGIQESPTKKRVRPECFVCNTEEELIDWMDARQSDMRVAVEVGNASEISRLAVLFAKKKKRWTVEELDLEPVHGQQHGDMMCDSEIFSRRIVSEKYGLRGVRIGEAAHPGQPMLHRLRRKRSASFVISSVEEPLMRGIARNVVPRIAGVEFGATQTESSLAIVPASQTALDKAGNSVSPDRVPMHVLDALKEDLERVDQVPRSPCSSQFALPVQNRFVVLDATAGRVATVAEPVFRRLRLASQGALVFQASCRVGVVDESMQDDPHRHEELSVDDTVPVPQEVFSAGVVDHHRRRRKVRSEGSDSGPPIYHDLTLIDSSDDLTPFVLTRSAAAPRPSGSLVLVPESVNATSQWTVNGMEAHLIRV